MVRSPAEELARRTALAFVANVIDARRVDAEVLGRLTGAEAKLVVEVLAVLVVTAMGHARRRDVEGMRELLATWELSAEANERRRPAGD